ncbi:DUF3352 domain-containing protein [Nocardioides zeae]|uniref:DUF3352 domain-containing protein n=1 Tax=Nocardioides zeae TaxID=1457234 RepID=A0AAJ1U322_9ACTN|nr:DUF3352 domain-containing protein [Nocardioides zeae]MDQ1103646.1 hypothetical protein [Nocardioides zeae]
MSTQPPDGTGRPEDGPTQPSSPSGWPPHPQQGYPQQPGYPQRPGYPQGPPPPPWIGPGEYGQHPGQHPRQHPGQHPGQHPAPRRRGRWIAGGVAGVLGLSLIGGGVWAWQAYFATGPQAAEALPADTLFYVGLDLDPSGQQKLAALDFLEKFPAFDQEVGLDRDDDVRREIFDGIIGGSPCDDLDFDDDVAPWLGDRFGVAVVPASGDRPQVPELGGDVVVVVQVDDADGAEAAMDDLADCSGAGDELGWAIDGGWMVVTDSDDLAEDVLADAADDPLTSDDTYQRWIDEAGDAGILSAYAAPESATRVVQGLVDDGVIDAAYEDEALESAEDFQGAALTLRFADGGLELETATQATTDGDAPRLTDGTAGELAGDLPADTAAVAAVGLADGWYDALLDQVEASGVDRSEIDDAVADLEDETGWSLPEDVETLLGQGVALSVGGGVDLDALEDGDIEGAEVGATVRSGDADAIADLVDELLDATDAPSDLDLNVTEGEDGTTVGSPSSGYADDLATSGGLDGSDLFRDVVPETDDVHALLFVDVTADGGWLADLLREDGDDELADNVEPLAALGLSVRVDGDVAHTLLRVTTTD